MNISGWGRFPKMDCNVSFPQTKGDVAKDLINGTAIARGNGRSYGDSAVNKINIIQTKWINQFLDFKADTGVLTVCAGAQICDIIQTFLPLGWLLPVTPGTRFVTIGGAIASDVHGKNHHHVGTFSNSILEIELMLGTGEIINISKSVCSDIFRATCGGMGLTGIILSAKIQLINITSSLIKQKTIKAQNLDHLFELFETNSLCSYIVAWVDCLIKNTNLGRSLLLLGEHVENGPLNTNMRKKPSIFFDAPSNLLNPWSVRAINSLHYNIAKNQSERMVELLEFFYPLDAIQDWNRLYGANGFAQYQFVIPKENGLDNMKKIISVIANSGEGSFLSVMKLLGKNNVNLLSFPLCGYTLALDFKINKNTIALFSKLDDMVADMGGRIYLTKDAFLTDFNFKRMYPLWEEFELVREKYGAIGTFSSSQSVRLGLK
jgi:decaprenylphospho-beta-D-ribofuranose 2-oxidase